MNCDDAFDRMTSPGAMDDAALAAHIVACRRCRNMQETLSPAIDWLASAAEMEFESPDGRPNYLTEDAVQLAERTAQRLSRKSNAEGRKSAWRRHVSTWFLAGSAVAICFFAVTLPAARQPNRDGASLLQPGAANQVCLWQMPGDRSTPPTADQVISTCIACHLPTGN